MLDALLLVAGLVLLTFSADRFVLGAARLSTAMRISPVIIGALVIGFGTSAPELLVTSLATLQGSQDLAFGNVVGSNTANVLLVLGAAALMSPLWVEGATLRRELPLSLIAVGALAALTFDREVSTVDAVLLLVLAAVVIGYLVYVGLRDREAAERLRSEVADYEAEGTPSVGSSSLLAVGGLLGTLAGAQILITGATGLARIIGISEAAIGLTIVAVGTSLPELVTAVVASRKNENDLVVGNILGSNIFNALPVAGVAGLLDTLELDPAFPASVAVMVAAVGLTAVFLFTGNRLGRREGAVLLVAFVAATVFVF